MVTQPLLIVALAMAAEAVTAYIEKKLLQAKEKKAQETENK